jgi:3'-phosphoadenosine 5'-phosphosulfate sulfotransferase (PAPS reductase)/FAD synthetase
MNNPYFINEPAAYISFSGGRTSAYMLYKILEAHDGKLPDDVKVAFANTGKEMPATYDFIRNCAENWGVDIVWLEIDEVGETTKADSERRSFEYSVKRVDYETASRNGEPFAKLIQTFGYLPNPVNRYCTTTMKSRAFKKYLRGIGWTEWESYLGIRADEHRRGMKMKGRIIEGGEVVLPMMDAGHTVQDVSQFWNQSNFDLDLPNDNGVTSWGNCDLCFLKARGKKEAIIRERPDLAEWWIAQELSGEKFTDGSANRFRQDHPSYQQMKVIASDQGQLFDFDDESIPCFCGD